MKDILFFDQGMIPFENQFSPFALTDVLTAFAGDQQKTLIHFWQLEKTLILGMKDSRVKDLKKAVSSVQNNGYQVLLRNAGGLGVISDSGVLNISLILPRAALSIDDGYEKMIAWLRETSLGSLPLLTGEVSDSYCPGKFDVSINQQKIAGIAQRRVKEGVAIMMYLSVNGDQQKRGEIVRDFYQNGLGEAFGHLGYPPVRPASMTTLSEAYEKEFTIASLKDDLLKNLDYQDQTALLSNFFQTEEYQQRLKNMADRNETLKEFLHAD